MMQRLETVILSAQNGVAMMLLCGGLLLAQDSALAVTEERLAAILAGDDPQNVAELAAMLQEAEKQALADLSGRELILQIEAAEAQSEVPSGDEANG